MIYLLNLEGCVLQVIILSRQDYFEYFERGTVSCLDPAVCSQVHEAHLSISCFHVAMHHLRIIIAVIISECAVVCRGHIKICAEPTHASGGWIEIIVSRALKILL
jgi:hypothetical protein